MDKAQDGGFKPYGRDAKLKRPWVKPGTPGLMHRIGGIEKELDTGHINYGPENHQAMTDIRSAKVNGVADSIPDQICELGAAGAKACGCGMGIDLRANPPSRIAPACKGRRCGPCPYPPYLALAQKYG